MAYLRIFNAKAILYKDSRASVQRIAGNKSENKRNSEAGFRTRLPRPGRYPLRHGDSPSPHCKKDDTDVSI